MFKKLKRRIDRFMREHAVRSQRGSGVDWSVAKTAREAMHVRGGNSSAGGSGRNNVVEQVGKGHKNYAASFEKDKKP